MLATTRTKPPATSLHSYLLVPDVRNNQWESNGTGEANINVCDKEIKLTEELKLYFSYFLYVVAGSPKISLQSFSEIPLKQNVKVPGN